MYGLFNLHGWLDVCGKVVGKYASPMDPIGKVGVVVVSAFSNYMIL